MNRINQTLKKDKKLLSIYFTAGFPQLSDTVPIIKILQSEGVDMIEIGLPFSDPLADGPVIQESSTKAIENGMTTTLLFEQLKNIRNEIHVPLIIMGYLNPMLQFGFENFCKKCHEVGIDGLIIPDLPLEIYQKEYADYFTKYGLKNVFLITPQTAESRIIAIDKLSDSFIYMVSTAAITGGEGGFGELQMAYFERIAKMQLKNPQIIGFGIKDKETLTQAQTFQKGGIIGSAFIKHLDNYGKEKTADFLKLIADS